MDVVRGTPRRGGVGTDKVVTMWDTNTCPEDPWEPVERGRIPVVGFLVGHHTSGEAVEVEPWIGIHDADEEPRQGDSLDSFGSSPHALLGHDPMIDPFAVVPVGRLGWTCCPVVS